MSFCMYQVYQKLAVNSNVSPEKKEAHTVLSLNRLFRYERLYMNIYIYIS